GRRGRRRAARSSADGADADLRPSCGGWCDRRPVPHDGEAVPRRTGTRVVTTVWYHVRDFDAARAFYVQKLGFLETTANEEERWATLQRDGAAIGLAEGEPQEDGGVAHVDVDDVKRVADELRGAGVDVGVVFELHGAMRLLDVFDADGNRLQFA